MASNTSKSDAGGEEEQCSACWPPCTTMLGDAVRDWRSNSDDFAMNYPVEFTCHGSFCIIRILLPANGNDLGPEILICLGQGGSVEVRGSVRNVKSLEEPPTEPKILNKKPHRQSSPAAPFSVFFTLPGPIIHNSADFMMTESRSVLHIFVKKASTGGADSHFYNLFRIG